MTLNVWWWQRWKIPSLLWLPFVYWDDLRRLICYSFIWIKFAMVDRLYIVFVCNRKIKIWKKKYLKNNTEIKPNLYIQMAPVSFSPLCIALFDRFLSKQHKSKTHFIIECGRWSRFDSIWSLFVSELKYIWCIHLNCIHRRVRIIQTFWIPNEWNVWHLLMLINWNRTEKTIFIISFPYKNQVQNNKCVKRWNKWWHLLTFCCSVEQKYAQRTRCILFICDCILASLNFHCLFDPFN